MYGMRLFQARGQYKVLRPMPSGKLDPFSASDNLNELGGENSPDQKANRHKQEAVNVVF
jgi:hypothetical protein